ncbi:MAG: ribosome biogenesis GTP-binding protein YihA/YsxC [Bacteroidota bacterium]|nr:ribosome biogenesis GTP-binding protein YihA/YsxC [Bacteroidota bacterium]
MKITSATFICSSTSYKSCPENNFKEYAFTGRSNVGKSSLINSLVNKKKLAKTSNKPGKTQLINHFLINNNWYLVDLPGYGYAKTSKTKRHEFKEMINSYLQKRENLICLFLLLDPRHKPQEIDTEFMKWLAQKAIPFVIVFTKSDKLSKSEIKKNIKNYKQELLTEWDSLPEIFLTSSKAKNGINDILDFIKNLNRKIN